MIHAKFCACSLSCNNLVSETNYVNVTKVQGDSFEVGAKVVYQGRKMVVSSVNDHRTHARRVGDDAIDRDKVEIRMSDVSGLEMLAEVLPQTDIASLECAAPNHAIAPAILHSTCGRD